jgi:hypothetical protein
MEKITLKDGKKAVIDTWDFHDLEGFLESHEVQKNLNDTYTVNGFVYLSPASIEEIRKFNKEKYSRARRLSAMEIQDQRNLENEEYTRCPVALIDDELAGIRVCWWINVENGFWRYHTKFTDVREDFRNLGIGRQLIRATDRSEFLNNRIFQAGTLSQDGSRYLFDVLKKEMNAETYAFIPVEYYGNVPPKNPGIYDSFGNLVEGNIDERFFRYDSFIEKPMSDSGWNGFQT